MMRRFIKSALLVLCALLILTAGILYSQGYTLYQQVQAEEPLTLRVERVRQAADFIPYEALPQMYVDAVIAGEDQRFWQHPGIDLIGIGRALLHDIKVGAWEQGGSTISQQLARNLYLSQEKRLQRKIAEALLAFDLEKEYSKDEIFALYANTIYFGNGYYGVVAAAQGYFGKALADLSGDACTLLACYPNAPSIYMQEENHALLREKQSQLLQQMQDLGYAIPQQDAA